VQALDALQADPFSGDVKKLHPSGWRKRAGSYRVFYDVVTGAKQIEVTAIERRTTTTY
jgi:mRNA-degrading endonuclease RelE of RelBE toxin-antitoxin system